jgi:putative ABC transport system ATP-binding protein
VTTSTALPDPALEVRALTRTYGSGDHGVTALNDVDLSLPRASFTAVMGPSGSGKSTLLNLVAGLDVPTGGAIALAGEDTTGWSEARRTRMRRDHIGIVFQGFQLVPYLTAEQNVGLPVRLAGRRPDRRRVAQLLADVGLGNRAGHLPGQLSGGQQQRVAIARSLVADPALVLADEPTGALDTIGGRVVLGLLRAAVDSGARTVLMVTHDPNAAAYADRVVFLVDGRLAGQMQHPTASAVADQMAHLDQLVGSRVAS